MIKVSGIRHTPLIDLMKGETDLRVSALSGQYLAEYLEAYAIKLTKVSEELAKAGNRKTISQEDIEKAIQITAVILDK